jgi:hypothetical protein
MTHDDPIKKAVRLSRKRDRLGDDAMCHRCGESDPRCLVLRRDRILCYECLSCDEGRSSVELHHVAGQHNLHHSVPIDGNEHRILSDMQEDWPVDTRRNSDGSPVLAVAAAIRGWLDTLRVIIERTMGWIPIFLERLDSWLRITIGDQYWLLHGFPSVESGGTW